MAASEHLNSDLFHGTGGAIEGGVVRPSAEGFHGPGAYAVDYEPSASTYAMFRASEQGRLFGTVYRVKPISEDPDVNKWAGTNVVVDPKGLKVVEAVSHPLNPDVDQGLVIGKKTYK